MARNLNGTTDELVVDPMPQNTGDFTIACWVKPGTVSPTNGGKIAGYHERGNFGVDDKELGISASGKLSFYCYVGSAAEAIGATTMTASVWQHVVGVHQPGAGSNRVTCWLNGVQDGSDNTAGNSYGGYTNPVVNVSLSSAIGHFQSSLALEIFDLRTWSAALTAGEIAAVRAGEPARMASLTMWDPTHGFLSPEMDYASLARVGTLTGTTATADPILASWPYLIGSGTASFTASSGGHVTPGLPTGWAAGDIHVMLAHNSANASFTTPSGWTIATDGTHTLNDDNTTSQHVTVYWRRAVAGDTGPTLDLVTNTVTTVRGAVIVGIRNCTASGVPFDVCDRLLNAAAATISFPSVTNLTNRALLLALGAYEDDPSARTTPTGWTQPTGSVFTSALGTDMSLNYFAKYQDQPGATGSFSTTVSGGTFANSVNVGAILAFRPDTSPQWVPPITELVSSGGMIGRQYVCEARLPMRRWRPRRVTRSPWKAHGGLYILTEALVRDR